MVGCPATSQECWDTFPDSSNDMDKFPNGSNHFEATQRRNCNGDVIRGTSKEMKSPKSSEENGEIPVPQSKDPIVPKPTMSHLLPTVDSAENEHECGEDFLQVLLEGASVPLDTGVSLFSRPPWIDENKLKIGREFANKYLFGLVFSEMMALVMLFSFRGGLEPLIFTGKSDTPYKAFRRYFSTVTRMMAWYEGDVFKKGSAAQRSMAAVRTMHASIYKRMNEASKEELEKLTTLEGHGTGIWSTYLDPLKKDFDDLKGDETFCPFSKISSLKKKCCANEDQIIYVNQLDLSLTQFGFLGLVILYPKQFGAPGATDEELAGFIHLWRCLGYLLGIKDRYNVCSLGGLKETRERCRTIVEKWVKPSLREVTPEWEHMFRCVVEGLRFYVDGLTFGGSLAYFMWVLDIPATNLLAKMTWFEKTMFHFGRFIMIVAVRIPGFRHIFNWLLHNQLNRVRKASPEWFQSKKDLVFDFHKTTATNKVAVD